MLMPPHPLEVSITHPFGVRIHKSLPHTGLQLLLAPARGLLAGGSLQPRRLPMVQCWSENGDGQLAQEVAAGDTAEGTLPALQGVAVPDSKPAPGQKCPPLLPWGREPEPQLQQTPWKQLNYAQTLLSGDSPYTLKAAT